MTARAIDFYTSVINAGFYVNLSQNSNVSFNITKMKILKYIALLLLTVSIFPAWSQKPESDARYQNIVREYTLMPDGSQIFRYTHQLKYLTHRAFNSLYGETFIVYNPDFQKLTVEKSETTMRDGKRVPSPANAFNEVLPRFAANAARVNHLKEMVVTHTGLEVDCSVELAYRIETKAGIYPGLFADLTLAEEIPTDRYTVVVKVPTGVQLNHQLSKLRLGPAITHEGAFDVYTWVVGATKPIGHENFLPADDEWLPRLRFSTMPSLYASYDWFLNQPLFTDTKLPKSATDLVTSIRNTEKSELALVLKIRDLVSSQMAGLPVPGSYLGYRFNTIAQVWNANAGTQAERTVLLAALLRHAGVKAEPMAIVPTACFEQNIGNPDCFDRYLVNIYAADGLTYSVAVGQYSNDARYLYPGEMMVKLEPAAENIPKTETGLTSGALKLKGRIVIAPDGTGTGEMMVNMLWASNPWFKFNNDNQSIKNYLTGLPSGSIKELKAIKTGPELTEAFVKIESDKLLTEVAPGIYSLNIPGFSHGISGWNLSALPTSRVAPFCFPSLHAESTILTITIPDNYVLLTPTVNLTQKTEWGNLMLTIRQRDNLITVERGFESVEKIVEVKDYEVLREMTNRWNNELYQRLVFQKNK